MAAPAPPLQVPSSAPVKFLSLSTKSMKAADDVILQTSNNIPWHLASEPSLLSSFTLHVCGLVEVVLRCRLASTNGQHWERASQPGQTGTASPFPLGVSEGCSGSHQPLIGTCPVKLRTLTKERGIAGILCTRRKDSVFACSFGQLDETSGCHLGTDIYGAARVQLTRADINGAM